SHGVPHGRDQGGRLGVGAYGQAHGLRQTRPDCLGNRDEDLPPGRLRHARLAHVADHTNYRAPVVSDCADALADWVLSRQVSLSQSLIDYHYRLGIALILRREESAAHERDAKRAEIIRADGAELRPRPSARLIWALPFDGDAAIKAPLLQGKVVDHSGGARAG